MRGEKGEKKFSYSITIWNVFIFIAIVITSIYRLSYAYGAMENDMLKLGQKIVLSYSVEQSGEFYIYERLINFSDEYLKNLKKITKLLVWQHLIIYFIMWILLLPVVLYIHI